MELTQEEAELLHRMIRDNGLWTEIKERITSEEGGGYSGDEVDAVIDKLAIIGEL